MDWEGQTVLDRGGEKVGTIKEIFYVEDAGGPQWALVKLGRLKGRTTLVPVMRANRVGKGVKIPYAKEQVADAPAIGGDGDPSEQLVTAVYRHYGIPLSPNGSGQQQPQQQPGGEVVNGSADLRDEPIGDLVKQVSNEASSLVRTEMKLAKAEVAEKAKDVGVGAGLFGGAGYLAHLAALAFMLCVIFALATAMKAWLAALIVAVVFGAGAGILALTGKKKIEQAGPPVPRQAMESVKQTIETVKEEASWGLGQTR